MTEFEIPSQRAIEWFLLFTEAFELSEFKERQGWAGSWSPVRFKLLRSKCYSETTEPEIPRNL